MSLPSSSSFHEKTDENIEPILPLVSKLFKLAPLLVHQDSVIEEHIVMFIPDHGSTINVRDSRSKTKLRRSNAMTFPLNILSSIEHSVSPPPSNIDRRHRRRRKRCFSPDNSNIPLSPLYMSNDFR